VTEGRHDEVCWERTLDGMFGKRVQCYQHRKGYRFSLDAVLLSYFAAEGGAPVETLDFGCGCGVVLLLLADLWREQGAHPRMIGVELQDSLASLARENIALNGFQEQLSVLQHNLRYRLRKGRWSLITFNPPYYDAKRGHVSAHPERAAARHELHATLEQMLETAVSSMHADGRLALVYPAEGAHRLLCALEHLSLSLSRVRFVHPFPGEDAKLVLIEAKRRKVATRWLSPWNVHVQPGEYTEILEHMLQGLPVWEDGR